MCSGVFVEKAYNMGPIESAIRGDSEGINIYTYPMSFSSKNFLEIIKFIKII